MGSFSELNEDVIANILLYLAPRDIISVRLTNKTAYLASKFRRVWYEALANRTHEEKLFGSPYVCDAMSTADLESAAVFPRSLLREPRGLTQLPKLPSLKRVFNGPVGDEETQSRAWVPEDDEDFGKWFNHITVVPGGRYIFTVSPIYPDERTYVKLWDIGRPGTRDSQIKCVAQHIHHDTDVCELKTVPIEDGRGIRLVMVCSWEVFVFEIYPENVKPAFKLNNLIEVIDFDETNIEFVGIHGDRIVGSVSVERFPFNSSAPSQEVGHIFVWDFIEDRVGLIHTGSRIYKACAIIGNSVISLHDNQVLVWDIPELQPPIGLDLSVTAPLSTPLSMYSHPDAWRSLFDVRQDILTLSLDQGWYSDPKILQLSTCEVDATTAETALFKINDGSIRSPLVHAKIIWGNHPGMEISDTLQLCHQNIIALQATSPGYVHVAGIPIPDQPSAKVIVPNVITFSMDGLKPDIVRFCLATGRCFALRGRRISKEKRIIPQKIWIFDYM